MLTVDDSPHLSKSLLLVTGIILLLGSSISKLYFMVRSITLLFLLSVTYWSAFAQNNFVEKGDKLIRVFKFEKAAVMYKKAADRNVNDVVAWQKLGNAFIMLGDNTSAEAIYQILTANPQSKPVDKFYYAQLLRNNGKYAEADVVYKNFAAALPADPPRCGVQKLC